MAATETRAAANDGATGEPGPAPLPGRDHPADAAESAAAAAPAPAPSGTSGTSGTSGPEPLEPVGLDEVNALMRYVAERGLDPGGTVLGPLYDAVGRLEAASDAAARAAAEKEVLLGYARLAELTYPHGVNGATLIDCQHVGRHIAAIVATGCVFFLLAIGADVLNILLGTGQGQTAAAAGWQGLAVTLPVVLDNLEPFFWGGLGAAVYLTKALSDKAAVGTYSRGMLHGTGSRIFLGAIIGAMVANLFSDPATLEQETRLTVGALAFLSGLGVRAIYAGFERLIDSIVEFIQPADRTAARATDG